MMTYKGKVSVYWSKNTKKIYTEGDLISLQDNWVLAGRPEPRTTSRFDTRVDYIFSSETFNNQWLLAQLKHVPCDASDHSLVVAEFTQI